MPAHSQVQFISFKVSLEHRIVPVANWENGLIAKALHGRQKQLQIQTGRPEVKHLFSTSGNDGCQVGECDFVDRPILGPDDEAYMR